ncbi:hypothetical protein JCGZ_22480 [Jatropha curcas]|uniref:FAD-binding FR-type domain-containing protein n=1 Tax=Jatropha curcas TaxID=180498 RepID=A0A067K389_JATCU|nr:hypothetical protein JCGZ_22480 [Jatropha curcas]
MEDEETSVALGERLRFIDIEWKEVEKRFDRLAFTGKAPEPVVKWSDFGFCIGMQQSPEFAKEVLMAIRGRGKKSKIDMTKRELHGYWHRLTDPCFNSRVKIFFDILYIERWKIESNFSQVIYVLIIKSANILLIASTNKLSLTQDQAEENATLIMEALDTQGRGFIELSQLAALFKISLPMRGSLLPNRNHKSNSDLEDHQDDQPIMSKPEVLFRAHWRRGWIVVIWLVICLSLFTWKFIQYKHRTAFEVMGYCLCTAKGAAETLKFNMAVILLPVCRNTITWLRRKATINSFVPFNDNINFHKLIAGGIVVGVLLHGGTHLACDFPRISGSNRSIFRQTIAARFGFHQPSYVQILTTTEVATGIAMVILMAIAFLLATKWPRRQSPLLPKSVRNVTGYNAFWYSHHLLILVYVLLIVHSMFLFLTDNVTEKTTWMYVAFPIMLYTGERFVRAIRSGFYDAKILKLIKHYASLYEQASIYPGKVLCLKLHKPEGFKYKSGMYIFLQCPQISSFQWHPFSLTSGPKDDHLSVHIRTLGDWSYQIYSLFQEEILSGGVKTKYPKIYIDGPYGSASQDYVKYDTVMLIGLGIGATPFISILKDLANFDQANCAESNISRGPLKAYFYWVTREQSSFAWFRDSLREISKTNEKLAIIEMHNFLTSVYGEGDARSALLSLIQALNQTKNGVDVVSRTEVPTQFGRPNWFNIFSKLASRHRGERIGVFYCGASALARELERLCTNFSTKTTTRFVFHKENY